MAEDAPVTSEPAAFLSHAHGDVFQMLRVSAAIASAEPGWILSAKPQWRALHYVPDVIPFEYEHGRENERFAYNRRCVARAQRERRLVLGQHGGLNELFVPIVTGEHVRGVLVVGPFGRARPTAGDILQRWRTLTGGHGDPADPHFAHFFSVWLATLVLDRELLDAFEHYLGLLARLMAGDPAATKLLAEADALRPRVEQARVVERIWSSAGSMVDEWASRAWSSQHSRTELERLGLGSPPDHVVVGMFANRKPAPDPVDELIRRDALQRECVRLALSAGRMLSGRVGEHGVTFLASTKGKRADTRTKALLEVAHRAADLASRRYGTELHLGVSSLPSSATLRQHYEAALGAAELALAREERVVSWSARAGRPKHVLGAIRRKLAEVAQKRPDLLPAHFERFWEAVVHECQYRLEPVRAHLGAGTERIIEIFEGSAAFDAIALDALTVELTRAEGEAGTIEALGAAHRRAVAALAELAAAPAETDRSRRLRNALAYVDRHSSETFKVDDVARAVGLSPSRFAHVFKEEQGVPFGQYVRRVRVERAKWLLARTPLRVARVAELSGFCSQQYFGRVFRSATGMRPLDWRRRNALRRSTGDRRKR
jgi:AraC-like DNA-binding protein